MFLSAGALLPPGFAHSGLFFPVACLCVLLDLGVSLFCLEMSGSGGCERVGPLPIFVRLEVVVVVCGFVFVQVCTGVPSA